ncbi:MAG: prephenate dehydrogenase/arogenate dehydrogenase family protein [Miltoncostaeaceae bacterium]
MSRPVAVVGVGLMGGSLALALRGRAGVAEVRGFDPDPEALAEALRRGVITSAAEGPEDAARGAGAVFLAAPVSALPDLAHRVLAVCDEDCVVSDLGSVKTAVLNALSDSERERFIGGHPVAGGERGGVAFAREELLDGATWFLTPGTEARPELFERLHGLVAALGARPVAIDPEVHDRLMALVSHLPHVLATALVNQAAAANPGGREALRSSGRSFADLTRVAGANPALWTDILMANREAVLDALAGHVEEVSGLAAALRDRDATGLSAALQRAAAGRDRLASEVVRAGEPPWRVAIAVPNRPGVLSEIATILGHAHINSEDLHLEGGPAGEHGELLLAVAGADDARRAASLVCDHGYRATAEPAD